MIDVAGMGQVLQKLFKKTADKVARETKFVQRESKMTGSKFLLVWVIGFLQHPKASLNILCQVAADIGVSITKQGIQKRLIPATVEFFEEMFSYAKAMLQNKIPISLALLTQFTAIELVDSSGIGLSDSLADEFPGAGRDGPKEELKMQNPEMIKVQFLTSRDHINTKGLDT